MFKFLEREKIREAIENRANSAGLKTGERRLFQRVARESRLFDKAVDSKFNELKKANPKKSDGQILKMLLDWISGGGMQAILDFIKGIIAVIPK